MMNMTWTCHICGKERPDGAVSVHTSTRMVGPDANIPMTTNVRCCNDDPKCIAAHGVVGPP